MMCVSQRILLLAVIAALAPAATLQQMSLEQLILKSTSILRGRVGAARTAPDGHLIYTLHRFEVSEQWKGKPADQVEIALPGGKFGDLQQRFSGVPRLQPGQEVVVFLWTGPSGKNHITGLSQGLFHVLGGEGQALRLRREPVAEMLLEPASGRVAESAAVEMPLAELITTIHKVLADGGRSLP